MAINHAMFTSEKESWCTPPALVARIVKMLGRIDLDPCSDDAHSIPALCHLTKDDNSLACVWPGDVETIFVNPPYGRELPAFVHMFVSRYRMIGFQGFTEGILLVPARTDTAWFQLLWKTHAICFIRGRLTFVGAANGAPFPSALAYIGPRRYRFADHFEEIGKCVFP